MSSFDSKSVIGLETGTWEDFRAPRNAFQEKVCILGAFLGSNLNANLLRNAAPEFASSDCRCLGDVA
jgi:hypothetical protein